MEGRIFLEHIDMGREMFTDIFDEIYIEKNGSISTK